MTDGRSQLRQRPSAEQIKSELERDERRKAIARSVRSTLFGMVVAVAGVVLLCVLFFPPLRIHGTSMTPTLSEGQVVLSLKTSRFQTGDVVAFNCNNRILVKRVICGPGDWFNMREDGTVLVNGVEISEPYLHENSFGPCDLNLPYQVPDERFFVLGDDRASSVDSRSREVGCISTEDIVGHVLVRIWPLNKIGSIE